jgi:hypothetical protein
MAQHVGMSVDGQARELPIPADHRLHRLPAEWTAPLTEKKRRCLRLHLREDGQPRLDHPELVLPKRVRGGKDLTRWEAAYLAEAIDVADFKAKKAEVDVRRTSTERELTRLDDQQRLIERADLETASLIEYCVRVRLELQHFTLDEKRRALEALDLTVIWHPDKPPDMYGSIPVGIVSNAPQ